MAFYDKIKWILGILVVFVLITMTNLIDRKNFNQVKDSVITIYEDRLIANDLIFEMSRSIQEKEIAFETSDSAFFDQGNNSVNRKIDELIARFEQTKLTQEESIVFSSLKENFQELEEAENNSSDPVPGVADHISKIKDNLYSLSKIQLDEGRRQMSISKRAINTVELFTQIEIYLLIFLAITIQIIVIYKPKKE